MKLKHTTFVMIKYILAITIVLFITACKKKDFQPVNPSNQNPDPQGQHVKAPKLTTSDVSNLTTFSVAFNGKIVDTGGSKINQFGFVVDTVPGATVKRNFNIFLVTQQNMDGTF